MPRLQGALHRRRLPRLGPPSAWGVVVRCLLCGGCEDHDDCTAGGGPAATQQQEAAHPNWQPCTIGGRAWPFLEGDGRWGSQFFSVYPSWPRLGLWDGRVHNKVQTFGDSRAAAVMTDLYKLRRRRRLGGNAQLNVPSATQDELEGFARAEVEENARKAKDKAEAEAEHERARVEEKARKAKDKAEAEAEAGRARLEAWRARPRPRQVVPRPFSQRVMRQRTRSCRRGCRQRSRLPRPRSTGR